MLPSQVLVPALGSGEALPNVSGRSYVVKAQQSQTFFLGVNKKAVENGPSLPNTTEQERCASCMKSSELVAGLFFRKVCLVGVPWCSGNTCLVTHVFALWNYVFHATFSIWGSDM